jgi:hypothetical protein
MADEIEIEGVGLPEVAQALGQARHDSRRSNPHLIAVERGSLHAHEMGAHGEVFFARALGLAHDVKARPEGDGGRDFCVWINGQAISIDVKTTASANPYLMVPAADIKRGADIYVLVQVAWGVPRILGWEHRAMMARMKPVDVGRGIPTLFRHHSELRDLSQLVNFLANRDQP